MNHPGYVLIVLLAGAITGIGGCAATGTLIHAPQVDLTSVQLTDVRFDRQTVQLGFDVDNPNPFPLPVRAVEYQVMLDDEKFAGGSTAGSFTVPAGGQDDFVISVELDVLNSASQMFSFVSGGMRDEIAYELQGKLTVDIPFARPLPFSSSGMIEIR